jgi:hypothetical protein
LLGASQVLFGIHGAQYVIGRNLPVKGSHQPRKSFLSNQREYVGFFHAGSSV